MFDSILQAAKHLATKAIARDPDNEKVIRAFIEYQLDRYARIRAAKNCRKRPLSRTHVLARQQSEVSWIDLNDTACSTAFVSEAIQQGGESPASFIETAPRGLRNPLALAAPTHLVLRTGR